MIYFDNFRDETSDNVIFLEDGNSTRVKKCCSGTGRVTEWTSKISGALALAPLTPR